MKVRYEDLAKWGETRLASQWLIEAVQDEYHGFDKVVWC